MCHPAPPSTRKDTSFGARSYFPGEVLQSHREHLCVDGGKYQPVGTSKNYDYGSGTSMSSPMTAAVAALVWSTPHVTSNSSERSRLQATADKIAGTGTYWSAGRVNAANAVAAP